MGKGKVDQLFSGESLAVMLFASAVSAAE